MLSLHVVSKLVSVTQDPYEAARHAHAIVVLTEWDEFKSSFWNIRFHMKFDEPFHEGYNYQTIFDDMLKPAFLFDGRLLLDHAALAKIGFSVWILSISDTISVFKE